MRRMDMRKVATVLSAIGASFVLASAASAATSFSIEGSNTPGTNVYSIVFSYAAGDQVQGYGISVNTSGTYTGAFTRSAPAPFGTNVNNVVIPGSNTGTASSWAAVSGGVLGPGGTFTIGTITITVAAGQHVNPVVVVAGVDGVLEGTGFGTTVAPDQLNGLTIIPEPTTAALLGLGLVGLVMSGRRGRA